jgi:MFS family permease
VSAAIGIIGAAAPMLQETFGGVLIGQPQLGFAEIKADEALTAAAAAVGAGFVGLISLFNIFGRIGWATSSDKLGRRTTYFIFFVLGIMMYVCGTYAANHHQLALFLLVFCVIASMYGGGFATIPAYLADLFGTQFVGAIHGRLLTAWSTAGILGPVIVNYLHDVRLEAKVPYADIYAPIFMTLAGLLAVGFVANLLVKPVADKYFMTDSELAAEQNSGKPAGTAATISSPNDPQTPAIVVKLAWLAVLIPITYGIWMTVQKAWSLFA